MRRIFQVSACLALIAFVSFQFNTSSRADTGAKSTTSRYGEARPTLAQSGDGADTSSAAASGPPQYTEAEFTSLDGEIYVNPLYTGKITSVRTINESGLLGRKIDVEVRVMTDGWRKFSLPGEASGAWGVIVSGEGGILKISKPKSAPRPVSGELGSLKRLLIEFGLLNATFTFPSQNVLEPSTYEIGILDTADNTFVNGSIIAMKSDQAAAGFTDLAPGVVSKDGKMRVSLKKPGGTYFNSDIPAWGYNIIVPETDIDTPAPITAEVFGLPEDAEIRFDFTSLTGQIIDPSTGILTVGEINKGSTVSTITTKIGGSQPLTVTVKRVK